MRIALDSVIYSVQHYGGISRYLSAIIPRMLALESNLWFELWCWNHLRQPMPSHPRIEHHLIPSWKKVAVRPRFLRSQVNRVLDQINQRQREHSVKETKASVWHSTYYWSPINTKLARVTNVYDLKEEVFPHLFGRRSARFIEQKKFEIERADRVICISESTREDVITSYGVDTSKIMTIPLAVDDIFHVIKVPDRTILYSYSVPQKPFILYVGRRDSFKNFRFFLECFLDFRLQSEFEVLLVGPELTLSEHQFISELRLDDRVHCLGRLGDAELCILYNLASAFVYPSLYEGFGLPLLEALRCGCPIVASRIPSSVEAVGQHAYYFDPNSSQEMLSALSQAIEGGRKGERIDAGIQWARKFSWDITAARTLNCYQSL